ncbi:MAG: DinB family protein [Spirochaetales bacterium]|jgi:uncharacterized damage-inducible protein DinB|nr:DinB family protein [Spirochaetales bacterium]
MNKDVINLLAKYNQAANEKMDALIKTLTPEEWDKNLGGFFKSIRELCSHLYVCDYILLKRYFKLRDFKLAKDSFFTQEYTFKDVLFPAKDEYLAKRPELDKKIIAFSEELAEDDFDKILKFADSKGNPKEKNFAGTLLHAFNHETHHRGMISVYLEILGKPNDFNALLAIVEKQG